MSELKSKGDLCVWGDSRNSVVGLATGDEFSNVYFRSREELDAHIASLRAAGNEAWGPSFDRGLVWDQMSPTTTINQSRPDGVDPNFGIAPAPVDVEHGGNRIGNVAFNVTKPADASAPHEQGPHRWAWYVSDDGQVVHGSGQPISQRRSDSGSIIGSYGPGSLDIEPGGNWSCYQPKPDGGQP